ncbi:hypothetical protein Plhal304r1_c006g0025001 [Plasmopara halstedii]
MKIPELTFASKAHPDSSMKKRAKGEKQKISAIRITLQLKFDNDTLNEVPCSNGCSVWLTLYSSS